MINFHKGPLSEPEQKIVHAGFEAHSANAGAPAYEKRQLKWLAHEGHKLMGALTADILWDWLYIDELWVDERSRGQGLGRRLVEKAEAYARNQACSGLWLWTQSWQAADFYQRLGYQEFARFDDFPKGYQRIGFRKRICALP